MTEQLEQELRKLFAEDAERAPVSGTLSEGALRRVRLRRRAQLSWATGAAAATVAAVAVVGGGLLRGQPGGDGLAAPPVVSRSSQPSPSAVAPTGPLSTGAAASCAEEYSPARVTARAFAFDGTVTAIGPSRTNTPEWIQELAREGAVPLPLVAATFTVHEWYAGGSGSTVTVDMSPPSPGSAHSNGAGTAEGGPSYGVGARLLVSGEHRSNDAAPIKPLPPGTTWKARIGGPNFLIAWDGCGFTRYHDKATADSWRAAFEAAASRLR